jgi:VWFA-related protein
VFRPCILIYLAFSFIWCLNGAAADQVVSIPVLPELSTSRQPIDNRLLDVSLLEDGERRNVVALLAPIFGGLRQGAYSTDRNSPGVIVVLLDAFNPTFPTSEERKAAAEKLIRSIGPESPVAIYLVDPELHVIQDFADTNGRSQLLIRQESAGNIKKALKAFDARPTNRNAVHGLPVTNIQDFQLATLESIATHVADLPGKKALIWFCETSGFSIENMAPSSALYSPMVLLLRALQASEMSIYSNDCFGRHLTPRWTPPEFGAVDMTRLHPNPPKYKAPKKPYLEQFAEFTGGRFYYGTDQLNAAISEASEDVKNSYRLKWQPRQEHNDRLLHVVQLTSSNPNIHMRYLHSYIDGFESMSLQDRLRAAERSLQTPLTAKEITVHAQIGDVQADGQRKVSVSFGPEHIRLSRSGGIYRGLLDVIYAFFDSGGHRMGELGPRNEVRLNVPEGKLNSFLNEKHEMTTSLTIPEESVKLRIVVRDAASGALGSTTVSL